MEHIKQKAENLTDHISDYIETYFKLNVLKATDKAAGIASVSLASIMIAIFAFFFLLFSGIGVGWWLGQQLDHMLAGFGIVAGFYALLVALIIVFRKNILLPFVRNKIIKMAYE